MCLTIFRGCVSENCRASIFTSMNLRSHVRLLVPDALHSVSLDDFRSIQRSYKNLRSCCFSVLFVFLLNSLTVCIWKNTVWVITKSHLWLYPLSIHEIHTLHPLNEDLGWATAWRGQVRFLLCVLNNWLKTMRGRLYLLSSYLFIKIPWGVDHRTFKLLFMRRPASVTWPQVRFVSAAAVAM